MTTKTTTKTTAKQTITLDKIEQNALWQEACALAEYMYEKSHDIPVDEKWDTTIKLRRNASDLVLWAGMAVGNGAASGREYDWGQVRRYLGGLKSLYRFIGRQKYLDLDPEIMVRLDKLRDQVDAEITAAEAHSRAYYVEETDKELTPWLKKYDIWKKLNQKETL